MTDVCDGLEPEDDDDRAFEAWRDSPLTTADDAYWAGVGRGEPWRPIHRPRLEAWKHEQYELARVHGRCTSPGCIMPTGHEGGHFSVVRGGEFVLAEHA